MQKHYSQIFYNMKKITFLLLLLFMAVGGVKAAEFTGTPEAGTPYKFKCRGAHGGGKYLADREGTLQGRDETGTYFILEATEVEGQYYIRSEEEGRKYINATGISNGSGVTFDSDPKTYWTFDRDKTPNDATVSWGVHPSGNGNAGLNNNGDAGNTCPYLKVGPHNDATNTCSIWILEIQDTPDVVKKNFDELKNAEKFGILEGSFVVGPNEFDNPKEINEAIEKANELDKKSPTHEEMEAFCNGEYGRKIRKYLDENVKYGPLFTYQLDVTRPYNTLILPGPVGRPDGMNLELYSCSGTEEDGTTLKLSPVNGIIATNVPYIIAATGENKKYTLIGWKKDHQDTHTSGWLTGVLKDDGVTVPSGSYVLATNKKTEEQAFYLTDGSVTCPQNKCYLRLPEGQAPVKALYFENSGTTTAIEDVFGENESNTAIYDLAGRRLTSIQKGVNIVNGRKVLGK